MLTGCGSDKQTNTGDNSQSSTTAQGTTSGENTSGQDAYTVKILAPGDASIYTFLSPVLHKNCIEKQLM